MAYQFNGSNYNRFTGGLILTQPTELFYSCWFKTTSLSSQTGTIILRSNGGPFSSWSHLLYYISDGANARIAYYIYDLTYGAVTCYSTNNSIKLNQWHHIALTSKNGNYSTVYVDGIAGTPVAVATMWAGGNDFYVGVANAGAGALNNCQLSNLLISYTMPSAEVVNKLSTATIRDFPITMNILNVVLYLPMTEYSDGKSFSTNWYEATKFGYTQGANGTTTCYADILSSQ